MIRLGDKQEATICYDTELMRVSAAWTGGWLNFSPARFGLISPPTSAGPLAFTTLARPGASFDQTFKDTREHKPYGALSPESLLYYGFWRCGKRLVLSYWGGEPGVRNQVAPVWESPWVETVNEELVITREFSVTVNSREFYWLICGEDGDAVLANPVPEGVKLERVPGLGMVLTASPIRGIRQFKVGIVPFNPNRAPEQRQALAAQLSPPNLPVPADEMPLQWPETIVTQGKLAEDTGPYVVDTLTVPFENPYNALMFISGHDFFPDGRAAVCTAHGDVWIVSGIDDSLQKLTWKRYATGLFQPLGLKIVKDTVYVLGRDQITRLLDRNKDGEADDYYNVNNEGHVTANAHEYATCLETDSQGNFYYLRGDSNSATQHDGTLLQVKGRKLNVFATGFRNANGLSIGPDDEITVAPQEGTWTPASAIFQVKQGGFYGAMQAHHRDTPPTTFEQPICWLPRRSDNSSGGQAWVTSDRWGPLKGQLLHFSFGTCRMFLIPREQVGGQVQGGSVPFPFVFDSGAMRGRFNPVDGQLYVAGLKGWVSSAVQDGCFQRVRYTGQEAAYPTQMETFRNGVKLTFSTPLNEELASDPGSFSLEQWNYRWTGNYGSAEYRLTAPEQIGRDPVEVRSATPGDDGRSVFLEIPGLQPVHQLGITYDLKTASGQPFTNTYTATLNVVPERDFPADLIRRGENPFALAPDLVEQLRPGVLWTVQQGVQERTHVSRLATWELQEGELPVMGLQPSAYTAQGTAYWKVPARKTYRLRVEGTGAVRIELDGEVLFDWLGFTRGAPPEITRTIAAGYHTLTIHYQPPRTGTALREIARIRLLASPVDAPLDPLWPTELFHVKRSDSDQLTAGQQLLTQHNCAACHADRAVQAHAPLAVQLLGSAPQWDPVAPQTGPALTRDPQWVAHWILDPHRLRATARMPRLLDANQAADRQAAADLALWLTGSAKLPATATNGDVDRGADLYESLGCLTCHRLPQVSGDDLTGSERISLEWVSAKFPRGTLAEFLRNPQQHYPGIRMPNFKLSEQEAADLETYLRSVATAELERFPELAQANAQRGAQLAQQHQCVRCHQPALALQQALKPWDKIALAENSERGCLAETPGKAPDFSWTDEERQTLVKTIQQGHLDQQFSSPEQTQLLLQELRCTACHDRDGRSAPVRQYLAEEGSGRPAEAWPHLTWTGEKLHRDWMFKFIGGKIPDKPRPWLKGRMPAFPVYAQLLTEGIIREHAISPQFQHPSPSPESIEIGQQLTFKTGGFDCRQCHGLGADIPQGDQGTQFAHGINFQQIRSRLRPDFYERMMFDPTRYDPSSRMPRFSLDGKTTAVKTVLDGDAQRQFDALWAYLQQVGKLP